MILSIMTSKKLPSLINVVVQGHLVNCDQHDLLVGPRDSLTSGDLSCSFSIIHIVAV
jgi:hypothetical protein